LTFSDKGQNLMRECPVNCQVSAKSPLSTSTAGFVSMPIKTLRGFNPAK